MGADITIFDWGCKRDNKNCFFKNFNKIYFFFGGGVASLANFLNLCLPIKNSARNIVPNIPTNNLEGTTLRIPNTSATCIKTTNINAENR